MAYRRTRVSRHCDNDSLFQWKVWVLDDGDVIDVRDIFIGRFDTMDFYVWNWASTVWPLISSYNDTLYPCSSKWNSRLDSRTKDGQLGGGIRPNRATMRKQINESMHISLLSENLLVAILLLVGLYLLQAIIALTLPLILFPSANLEVTLTVISNSHLIGNLIFGLVVVWLTRREGLIAISIGVLSIVLPAYGLIFFILTKLPNIQTNDRQKFQIDK